MASTFAAWQAQQEPDPNPRPWSRLVLFRLTRLVLFRPRRSLKCLKAQPQPAPEPEPTPVDPAVQLDVMLAEGRQPDPQFASEFDAYLLWVKRRQQQ